METNYTGIDYGLGLSNINTETGIRFGVINQREVLQAWADDSEMEYGKPYCPDCFNDLDETSDFSVNKNPVTDEKGNEIDSEYFCSVCDKGVDDTEDIWPEDPLGFYYDSDGYLAHQTQDDTDIFITKSPYYSYSQFCSPCAPGAGYLMNEIEPCENNKTYCFGHDWFEDSKAPYTVYSVKTGKEVTID